MTAIQQPHWRIGQLAKHCGCSADALRHYERLKLIQSHRLDNNYRVYPPDTAVLVRYIARAQQLGFSLREIAAGMPLASGAASGPSHSAALSHALQQKISALGARIGELSALREELVALVGSDCPLAPKTAGVSP